MVKPFAFALLACIVWTSACSAVEPGISLPDNLSIRVDWQEPNFLPQHFRNHCGFENFTGRPYCSDHCGVDYQFYYCSEGSFGCCHLGDGYCDFSSSLRCHP